MLHSGSYARHLSLIAALILPAFFVNVSCGHHRKSARYPATPSSAGRGRAGSQQSAGRTFQVGYTEQGTASWYGIPYHGRPAADGEIYNMETLVAAHRVLPFNTWLRVTNLGNLKSVDVRVIDRGPFVDGRILDLSKAAARQIDLLGPGIGPVKLEVIASPVEIRSNDFFAVQVGAFSVAANAEHVRSGYAARFGSAQTVLKQGSALLYRVLVGKLSSTAEAQKIADQIISEGQHAFVVRLDETVTGAGQPPSPAITPRQP